MIYKKYIINSMDQIMLQKHLNGGQLKILFYFIKNYNQNLINNINDNIESDTETYIERSNEINRKKTKTKWRSSSRLDETIDFETLKIHADGRVGGSGGPRRRGKGRKPPRRLAWNCISFKNAMHP